MIEIKILATGSKGNAYTINEGRHSILIDPGIPFGRLNVLTEFKLQSFDFCLVSHEHKDHSKAVHEIEKLGIPLIMSTGTGKALNCYYHNAVSEVPILDFCGWDILPFELQHDAAEPLGFLIRTPAGKKILYVSDTYYIQYSFSGVSIYMVEANYQESLLSSNDTIHPVHKDRVRQSHFEIENMKLFFASQDLSKTEKIYLIHLSDDNSDEEYFKSEIEKITGVPVYFR